MRKKQSTTREGVKLELAFSAMGKKSCEKYKIKRGMCFNKLKIKEINGKKKKR